MSTYVLMRFLESAPARYDLGVGLLTLGRREAAYDRLIARVPAGAAVLDLGCGTGALALRAARRGARVKGIDTSAAMLEMAGRKARDIGLGGSIEFVEMGIAELDAEPAARYDCVTCGLCLSELAPREMDFALAQVARILKPGGLFLVADEVRPDRGLARFLLGLVRAPLTLLTLLLNGQTTHPVEHLPARLEAAGWQLQSVRRTGWGSFIEVVAEKAPR